MQLSTRLVLTIWQGLNGISLCPSALASDGYIFTSRNSLMVRSVIHPRIASERLRHATVAFTPDTCSHVVPGLQEAAAMAFDNILKLSSQSV